MTENTDKINAPFRDLTCLNYDVCLNEASRIDGKLSCEGCSFYQYHKLEFTDADIRGAWALAMAVFGVQSAA